MVVIAHQPYLNIVKERCDTMKIERVKLFPNNNDKSLSLANSLAQKLSSYGYQIVEDNYELAIAIGGDGSYLRMVKQNNFNSNIYYIGINMGTLGFLQEIKPDEVDDFLKKLNNEFYRVEHAGIQETKIITPDREEQFYSLNEIAIRDASLKITNLGVHIDDELLENYTGDGLLITTSIGSTAYNISLGGSIVYGDLHTLQITPIAPLNTRAYRDLLNSIIIPEHKTIRLIPKIGNQDLLISIDGENNYYSNVQSIDTSVSHKKIKCLRMTDYNYTKIIREKFLK